MLPLTKYRIALGVGHKHLVNLINSLPRRASLRGGPPFQAEEMRRRHITKGAASLDPKKVGDNQPMLLPYVALSTENRDLLRPRLCGRLGLHFRQLFDRLKGDRIQTAASRLDVGDDLAAHSWIPEFFQMIRGAGDGLLRSLAFKELGDLIGHVNELVRR